MRKWAFHMKRPYVDFGEIGANRSPCFGKTLLNTDMIVIDKKTWYLDCYVNVGSWVRRGFSIRGLCTEWSGERCLYAHP